KIAKCFVALGRREGAHRTRAADRAVSLQAESVLRPRRSRCSARRRQRGSIRADGAHDERDDAIHRHHAQQAYNGNSITLVWSHHGRARCLQNRFGQTELIELMITMASSALMKTDLPGIKLHGRGKVRDIYDLGEHLLIVATDRLSAFDVVLPTPIPNK